ncbi:MAG: hypothetical protein ACFFDN_37415, partial [Candidatus Hodarchaeota archaeon]
KEPIQLDYSKDMAKTEDLMAMRVDIPQSQKSGSDARKNKQVKMSDYDVIFCTKCKVILGFSWNSLRRRVYAT